jgi:hypothetical protein
MLLLLNHPSFHRIITITIIIIIICFTFTSMSKVFDKLNDSHLHLPYVIYRHRRYPYMLEHRNHSAAEDHF